jgi:hypothetical protein
MKRDADLEARQVAHEIASLGELDAQSLRKKWQELYGTKAPRCARPSLMVRAIAYKLQDNAFWRAQTFDLTPASAGRRRRRGGPAHRDSRMSED